MLEALALVSEDASTTPDVIITDVQMPGFTGLNVVDELRSTGWRIPIIVITGFSANPAVAEHLRACDDVVLLAKPFDPRELSDLVHARAHRSA